MKKTELRKIIRESINQLMTEQSSGEFQYTSGSLPSGNCKGIRVNKCDEDLQYYNGGSVPMSVCAYIDGNVPQIGDTFLVPAAYLNHYSGIYDLIAGHVVEVTHLTSPPSWHGGTSYTNITSSPCTPTPPTSGCDPSAWSNHANWTATFTNTVTNANNTCNFLNNKIAQFTGMIPNVGPVWANQLQCKLDLCNQLHASNNC
tara:strand:- start:76 stop:678 length:603 start_codon:yes stop_codon:yes gene_type:complete